MSAPTEEAERWKGQLTDLQTTVSNQEFFGDDGEPIEFEWSILPGRTPLEMLRKIQSDLQSRNIQPESNYLHVYVQRHYLEPEKQ